MPHRRDLKGVLHNFLATYTSRYSDHDGYWLWGLLAADLDKLQIDLLEAGHHTSDSELASAAADTARAKFSEHLEKARIPKAFVREAHLTVSRSSLPTRGLVNGLWNEG